MRGKYFSDKFFSCLHMPKDAFLEGLEDQGLIKIPYAVLK